MAGADTIEQLRQFLRELSPKARSLLVGELKRSLLHGGEVAGTDLSLHKFLLQELGDVVCDQREVSSRISNSARLFFRPLEPFLVFDRGDHNHPGRIARSSLEMLWTWIRRDLLPEDSKSLADEVSDALLTNDEPKANHAIRRFQDRAVTVIETSLESAVSDEKIRRRMLAQIGTQRPMEDAATLSYVLKRRDALAALSAQLPLRIGNLTDGLLDECKLLIENASARDGEMFLYALLTVMSQLAAPWQLIRLGTKAAGSDTAARVAETHYGLAVTIVLADLDRMVGELRDRLRGGQGVAIAALLKNIHDAVRGLRTELDLPVASTWGRALGTIRSQVTDLLRTEIESMASRIRCLLRSRSSSEIQLNSVLDSDEVVKTETLVAFIEACRLMAGELAITEMAQRNFTVIQKYPNLGTRPQVDGVRQAGLADRSFRRSQVDPAVRLSTEAFGPDYGSLLGKAAEVASASERRGMQA
jgi:hypothetical protein